jgi:hypothetical protein
MIEEELNSEKRVDKFKYDLEAKKIVFEKLRINTYSLPVIVYVKNPNISDIRKTVYLSHRFTEIKKLIYTVRNNMYFKDEEGQYGLLTELDDIGFLLEDSLIEEVYEDFGNRDKFLYLIFDKKT